MFQGQRLNFDTWNFLRVLIKKQNHRYSRIVMLMDLNAARAIGLRCAQAGSATDAPRNLLFTAYGAFVPQEECARTLLASDDLLRYRHRIIGKPLLNPVTTKPVAGGLKQYVYPVTEELSGKALDLRLDGQPQTLIRFTSSTKLEWATGGKPFQQETYDCVKAGDSVYLIVCHPHERMPAPCVTLVWDVETRLVTAVLAWDRSDPLYPRLVVSRACFGVENREGEKLPTQRHHYTTDLIGRRFVWHYTANDDVLHICFDPTHFRLGRAAIELAPNPSAAATEKYEQLLRRKEKYPYYEEKVYYIRIREGLYLYSVIEDAMCRRLGNQGGGELLALVNTARVCYIGRSFGLDAQENAGHDLVGAPGSELNIPDEVESLPCPLYPL